VWAEKTFAVSEFNRAGNTIVGMSAAAGASNVRVLSRMLGSQPLRRRNLVDQE
jgi:hypothetical protein